MIFFDYDRAIIILFEKNVQLNRRNNEAHNLK